MQTIKFNKSLDHCEVTRISLKAKGDEEGGRLLIPADGEMLTF